MSNEGEVMRRPQGGGGAPRAPDLRELLPAGIRPSSVPLAKVPTRSGKLSSCPKFSEAILPPSRPVNFRNARISARVLFFPPFRPHRAPESCGNPTAARPPAGSGGPAKPLRGKNLNPSHIFNHISDIILVVVVSLNSKRPIISHAPSSPASAESRGPGKTAR